MTLHVLPVVMYSARDYAVPSANTHDFADGRKNMNGIFNNYVCSASHMHPGRRFQNV